jgi:osmotically-inducible protein OsmY
VFARLSPGRTVLPWILAAVVLSACTSDASSPGTAPDSAATASPTTTVSETRSSPEPPPSFPSEAEAEARSVAQKLSDTSTETRVERALVQTSSLRVFSFRPTVVKGHLALRGDVNTVEQYRRAERTARQVEGVEVVTNQLTVGGRPVTEDRLSEDEEAAAETGSEDTAVYHTVRQGDNLWDIARKYRASVEQIRRLNDLGSSTLRPGQRIRVR